MKANTLCAGNDARRTLQSQQFAEGSLRRSAFADKSARAKSVERLRDDRSLLESRDTCTTCTDAEPSLHRVMGPWLLLLFIVGDILGTGIYALTGQVANQVGGVVWLPFLVAFVVALITALSYLELVTKYPKAAGAALYTHKAFGIHFVTFIVAFAVMCSGITSASTASRAFSANMSSAFGLGFRGSASP